MNSWKEKLKEITNFASNIDLYNTERIRKGELQELVVCISDVIPFIGRDKILNAPEPGGDKK